MSDSEKSASGVTTDQSKSFSAPKKAQAEAQRAAAEAKLPPRARGERGQRYKRFGKK